MLNRLSDGLNSQRIKFITKTLIFYIIWYVAYDLLLKPNGHLDYWAVYNTAKIASVFLHSTGFSAFWRDRMIGLHGAGGIMLVNGCSGVSSIGVFMGFIIAWPGRWSPRIYYMCFGAVFIYCANVIRIIVLVITQKYAPLLFEFTHDYSTTLGFYLIIFALWVIWFNLDSRQYFLFPGRKLTKVS